MQENRIQHLTRSAKALAVQILATIVFTLPFSESDARAQRENQAKAEPTEIRRSTNSHNTNRRQPPPAPPRVSPNPPRNPSPPATVTRPQTTTNTARNRTPPTVRQTRPTNPTVNRQPNQPSRITQSPPRTSNTSPFSRNGQPRQTVQPAGPTQRPNPNIQTRSIVSTPRRPTSTVSTTNQIRGAQNAPNRVVTPQTPTKPPPRRSTIATASVPPRTIDRTNNRSIFQSPSAADITNRGTSTKSSEQTVGPHRPDPATKRYSGSKSIVANTPSRSHYNQRGGDRQRDSHDRNVTREETYRTDRDTARTAYLERKGDAKRATNARRDHDRKRSVERHGDHDHDRHDRADRSHSRSHRGIARHSHRHGNGCGHHFYDNCWHDYPKSHRHYNGCGHYRNNNVWISFSVGHVHGIGCGHFYESGIWLSYSGSIHRHHAGCGHYYYGGIWNNTSYYHVHGAGCGHYYYNDSWNDFPSTHYHTEYCGHLYDGTNWLVVSEENHVHSGDCGHHRFLGAWYAYPREYYTMGRSESLFFFVDLGNYQNRNLPKSAYEAFLADRSPIDIFRSTTPLGKAYTAFAKGRYYDSLIQFRLACRIEPDNALILLARAQAQIAVKDYRLAFDDITLGLESFPEWTDSYINLSEIYSNSNDLALHTKQLEEWVERYPRDYKAHFVLGYFYYFLQEYDSAKNELIYALSWDNNLKAAHNLMDHILQFEAESEVLTLEQEEPLYQEPEVTTE